MNRDSDQQIRKDYKINFTDKLKEKLMHTFGSGKSSPFERVDFFLYHFLSSLSKVKQCPYSTQRFAVAEATFDLTRFMFDLFFTCQIYAHARYFTK